MTDLTSPGRPTTPAVAPTEDDVLLATYGPRPVRFASGHGSWLVADDGTEHLDFLCGLAVTSLGHAHPAITRAVAEQAATLTHVSNLFGTAPAVELAARLRDTTGWPDARTFFCNSGAEANEAAIKLARRHGKAIDPAKVGVVALQGSFHGRLMGALKLTGNPAKHAPFEPLGDWVTHVPHDDPDALRAAVDDSTCAVWLEVVQGEGGVRPLSPEMLRVAREACDAHDALLVIDEVQTGIGRLGEWYGFQTTDITPDVICLAKGLANGLPIGAIVARGDAAGAFGPGDHATTFGGNPVVCAAANAVMQVIEDERLLDHVGVLAARLHDHVATWPRSTIGAPRPHGAGTRRSSAAGGVGAALPVLGVRGRGMLQAIVLEGDLAAVATRHALDNMLIVNNVAPDAIRLAPPLNLTTDELDSGMSRLRRALEATAEGTS